MQVTRAPRVSLVVAVTGHRDLVPEETPRIRATVREFLLGLERDFPELPLLIVTPVADGADRLVAEVAAAEGIELLFVLPMPREIYREDFDELSGDEFDRLLTLGEAIELPLVGGNTPELIRSSKRARDLQYERLGVYIAAHCHILLALWDGEFTSAAGGTGHVVQFHQQDLADLLDDDRPRSPIDFSEDESDLVYHVRCSRRSASLRLTEAGRGNFLTRDEVEGATEIMPIRYRTVFRRMAEFNQDLARAAALPTEAPVEEPWDEICRRAGDIEGLYRQADAQARWYQRRALRALKGAYVLAGFAGLSFIAYADLTALNFILLLYLLFVACGAFLYLLERRGGWYRRYLDYRALAEGLRVQFFWALAGVRMARTTAFPHDSFMRRQDLELGWIRNVMRFAGRRADAEGADQPERGTEIAMRAWVGDEASGQAGYYRSKAAERRRRSRFTTWLGTASFAAGLGCAVVLALAWGRMQEPWSNVLIALMGVLPFLAAIRQSYAQRVSERELINQYEHMQRLYTNANRLLSDAASLAARQEVLRALGEAALDENALWLLRQRERPIAGSDLLRPG